MFIKVVIILLLLIVAASLLTGRGASAPRACASGRHAGSQRVRTLMLRVALVLLALGALLAVVHLTRN